MLKILLCMFVIGFVEYEVEVEYKKEGKSTPEMNRVSLEISMAILMGAWMISGGNLLW